MRFLVFALTSHLAVCTGFVVPLSAARAGEPRPLGRPMTSTAILLAAALIGPTPAMSADSHLGPRFQYVDSRACGDVVAFTWNRDRTEQLVVHVDAERLRLPIGATRSLHFDANARNVEAYIDLYDEPPTGAVYCTDLLFSNDPRPTVWVATAGKVTVRKYESGDAPSFGVDIRLEGVTFASPNGQRITTKSVIVLHGRAGRLPAQ